MSDSKKIDDGGPAFQVFRQHPLGRLEPVDNGMSLRDWFAGQALISGGEYLSNFMPEDAASRAYALADAMIAARSRS